MQMIKTEIKCWYTLGMSSSQSECLWALGKFCVAGTRIEHFGERSRAPVEHTSVHSIRYTWLKCWYTWTLYKKWWYTCTFCKILLTSITLLLELFSFFTYGSRSTGTACCSAILFRSKANSISKLRKNK